MPDPPEISVVICTHNRPRYLSLALDSLASQTFPAGMYEVIVVDDDATETTRNIAGDFYGRINLHYHATEPSGLSDARNTGIRASEGKYIAFLDDDAVAGPDWLREIFSTFTSLTPQPDACGGPVDLIWESPRPEWMTKQMAVFLGRFDYGETGFFIRTSDRNPGGLNMAIKKTVFLQTGMFDPALGRQEGVLLSNEEVDYFRRMRDAGMHLYYNPRIRVQHHVPTERTRRKWFFSRYYWQGRSSALMTRLAGSTAVDDMHAARDEIWGFVIQSVLALKRPKTYNLTFFFCKGFFLLGYLQQVCLTSGHSGKKTG